MTFRTRKCSENKEKRGIDSSLFCLDNVVGFFVKTQEAEYIFYKRRKDFIFDKID